MALANCSSSHPAVLDRATNQLLQMRSARDGGLFLKQLGGAVAAVELLKFGDLRARASNTCSADAFEKRLDSLAVDRREAELERAIGRPSCMRWIERSLAVAIGPS